MACSDVKSSGVNTSGIYAEISAIVKPTNQTDVKVVMRVGDASSNTFIELDSGDSLEASDGISTEELGHSSFGSIHSYSESFDTTDADTEFTINLKRELETSAPSSVATLPADFSFTAPADNTTHSRQDPLTISWDASAESSDTMAIEANGSCVFSINAEVPFNVGSYTIDPDEFESIGAEDTAESCELEIDLQRQKAGTLDPAYGSGLIFGGVLKTQTIRLDP